MKSAVSALVPAGMVTKTLARPAAWAGVVAVIVVSLITVKFVKVPPMFTAVAPVKFVPVIVTLPPPTVLPMVGEMAVSEMVGACSPLKLTTDSIRPELPWEMMRPRERNWPLVGSERP